MKVLLAAPENHEVYALFKPLKVDRIMPPLALMYLEAYLLKEGHTVKIWDGCTNEKSFIEVLDEFMPEILGVGGTTPEVNFSYELFKICKEYSKDIITVAGGPHFSMFTPEEYPEIDYIIKGDGEIALNYLANGNKPDENVIEMLPDDKIYEAPQLRWDKIDFWKYNYAFEGKLVPTAVMLTSRGCPYRCTFCHNSKNYRKVRFRTISNVISEIETIKSLGINFLVFLDETFSLKKSRTIELCRKIKEYNIRWKCLTRADCVNEELVKEMTDSGCVGVSIGVESGNPQIVKDTNKKVTIPQVIKAFDILNKFEQVEKRASFIIGHPYETEKTVQETINLACSLPADKAFFNIMTPYPSSLVYDQALKGEGLWLVDDSWENFKRCGCSAVRTKTLSPEDLVRLQKKAHMAFYLQPRIILNHIKDLADTEEKKFCVRPLMEALTWKKE